MLDQRRGVEERGGVGDGVCAGVAAPLAPIVTPFGIPVPALPVVAVVALTCSEDDAPLRNSVKTASVPTTAFVLAATELPALMFTCGVLVVMIAAAVFAPDAPSHRYAPLVHVTMLATV